jgi:hypothetical protein
VSTKFSKLRHPGLIVILSFIMIASLTTCGKQKRKLGDEADFAEPISSEGAGLADDAAKGEVIVPTPVSGATGTSRQVSSDDSYSIFQITSTGSGAVYNDSAATFDNLDLSTVSVFSQPMDVVEDASTCDSPGRVPANDTTISICVGSTKIAWATTGAPSFVVKVDSEVGIAVLSKPQSIKAFVGTRGTGERFHGSTFDQLGDTLVLMGDRDLNTITGAGVNVVTGPSVNQSFNDNIANTSALDVTPDGGNELNLTTAGVIENLVNAAGNPSVADPVYENSAAGVFLNAKSVGFYLSDSSLIQEMETNSGSTLSQNRSFLFSNFLSTNPVGSAPFDKMAFLNTNLRWTIATPIKCTDFTSQSVIGVKLYHLLIEATADTRCIQGTAEIEVVFPKLVIEETVSDKTSVSDGKFYVEDVTAGMQTNGKKNMGFDGWKTLSTFSNVPERSGVHTSVELLFAPALAETDQSVIYAAHLFVKLPEHNSISNDMKGRSWDLVTQGGMSIGVHSFKNDDGDSIGAPFHTVTARPHLAFLNLERSDVSGAWMAGDVLSANYQDALTFKLPLFSSDRQPTVTPILNSIGDACGFEIGFTPLGDTLNYYTMNIVMPITENTGMPYIDRLAINSVFDLLGLAYVQEGTADCIPPAEILLLRNSTAPEGVSRIDKLFDPASGPSLDVHIELSRIPAPSPTPSPSATP